VAYCNSECALTVVVLTPDALAVASIQGNGASDD
jgi:hypothetical protein